MARALSDAAAVRARIAEHWFDRVGVVQSVGRFTLRASQCETLERILQTLRASGGALLADPPGTGKTVIALALARQLDVAPLVVAPAALRDHWHRMSAKAGVSIAFASFESLGRGRVPPGRPLLLVDEAHHARTPGTRRYVALAALATGAQVLLLTATPVVNRVADRDALLSLFAEHGTRETASTLIIRSERSAAEGPRVERLPPLRAGEGNPEVAAAIPALPPPFPAADGAAAAALVRLTLGMAWRSSLAALDHTLRRRLERATALQDVLREGRWPSRGTLRHWVLGDDATQLALPFVLDGVGETPPEGALETLAEHLKGLAALRGLVGPEVSADTSARARAIETLAAQHAGTRLVVFGQFAATIRALWRALAATPGVVAITGEQVRAAAGRWSRDEVLRALGPDAAPFRAKDPRGIRILLATDLLSEGVELQGVGIVVHADVPWTPARIEQRVGRATRSGNPQPVVFVTHFTAPRGATALLQLRARLTTKRAARAAVLAGSSVASEIAGLLSSWRVPGARSHTRWAQVVGRSGDAPRLLAAANDGQGAGPLILAGSCVAGRWRLTTRLRAIRRALLRAGRDEVTPSADLVVSARHAVAEWLEEHRAQGSLADHGRETQRLWRRLHRHVEGLLESAPLAERAARATEWSAALRILRDARGIGALQGLRALLQMEEEAGSFGPALLELARRVQRPPLGSRVTREPALDALLLIAGPSASG